MIILPSTDECLSENGGCDHICIDTAEAYECQCNMGFVLGVDGHSCTGTRIYLTCLYTA